MPTQHHGYCWPDAAGTPTDPTAAFAVVGVPMYFQTATRLYVVATVSGVSAEGIQVEVELGTMISGSLGYVTVGYLTMVHGAAGAHIAVFDVPENSWVRLTPRRVGGAANTLLSLWVEPRSKTEALGGLDGQPIELLGAQLDGVVMFDDGAGGAEALGTPAFALGPAGAGYWLPVGVADELRLVITLSGGPTTNAQIMIQESPDMTLAPYQEVISSVSGGVDDRDPGIVQINGADGDYLVRHPVQPGTYIRVWMRRVGAAASAIVRAYPYRSTRGG